MNVFLTMNLTTWSSILSDVGLSSPIVVALSPSKAFEKPFCELKRKQALFDHRYFLACKHVVCTIDTVDLHR